MRSHSLIENPSMTMDLSSYSQTIVEQKATLIWDKDYKGLHKLSVDHHQSD